MKHLYPDATEEFSTRSLMMPDGIGRVVALQKSYWECLDWMIEERGQSLAKITDFCSRHLSECPKDDFNAVLERYIHRYMQEERAKEKGVANEDFYSPEKDWSK